MVTTPEVLAEEDRLAAFAREGRGTRRPLGIPGRPLRRDWLNAGQRRAVRHILSSRDRVILLRGAAGTGKTTLMQEAVEAIGEGGHQVVVLAPSAGASRDVLRGAGFKDADTVAMFLKSEAMQRRAAGQVIWVDEAGLLNSQDTAALFDVAERVNARVILMGDRRQHSSPSRGSPLKLLEEEAGVPSVAVTEIMRQEGDYKKAVRLLSEDKVAEGFDELDRLGWVREVGDKERYLRLAEGYLAASAEKRPDGERKTALVVSPTHAEGQRITEVIRAATGGARQARRGARVYGLAAAAPDASGAGRGGQLRRRRHAPVPPERQGLQERPASASWATSRCRWTRRRGFRPTGPRRSAWPPATGCG